MVCIKCQAELPDGAIFCPMCGKKQTREKSARTHGNGIGTVYKRGKTWSASVTIGWKTSDNKKKPIKKTKGGFKTKKEAAAYLPKLYGGEQQKDATVFSLYTAWSDMHYPTISADKACHYRTAFAAWNELQSRKITTIALAELQSAVDALETGYYPKRDMKIVMSKIYEYALIHDLCKRNLAEYIRLPKNTASKHDAYSEFEKAAIWKDWKDNKGFAGVVLVMLLTGLRPGEARKIRSESVHVEQRYMIGGIKTPAGIDREIPIAEKIVPIIEYFLTNETARLFDYSEKTFYAEWAALVKRTGIRDLGADSCRHTWFTNMAESDVQPEVITQTGGHTKLSTSMLYTHVSLDAKRDAVNRL